ncbi:PREDICTED: E3 ubiquitin-protein ligase MBR2-like [Erythranthe guttata]|uniref:E3 ubiquitin-protein ligase MBR2-like n=1 Tax=Erythranthe guttata TaxID=4155 RepID=UPI00064DF45E|nr:PREDICTED: E3 ubiquitin-protein ligase MBR2-like [Erythranthe guttata]|eukprot:XP_012854493.1 PREDICTED: E3 ubiquitin-protein ligase MBR2-like [Erythranthe guttata]
MQPRSAPPPPVNFTSIVSRPPNRINPNNRMSNAGASLLRYQDQYLYDDRYFFNEEEVALILELSDDDDDVVVLDDSNNFTGGGGDNYEQEVCVICQDDLFGEHENIIATLDCGHVYHVECIKKWLRSKNECPICKARALNFN